MRDYLIFFFTLSFSYFLFFFFFSYQFHFHTFTSLTLSSPSPYETPISYSFSSSRSNFLSMYFINLYTYNLNVCDLPIEFVDIFYRTEIKLYNLKKCKSVESDGQKCFLLCCDVRVYNLNAMFE